MAIIGLFLGGVGAGLGGYVFITNKLSSDYTTTAIYYEENLGDVYLEGGLIEEFIPDLYITFDVTQGDAVYLQFDGSVVLGSAATNLVYISFKIDGITLDRFVMARAESGVIVSIFPVSLQQYNTTLTPGEHAVSVVARSDGGFNENYIFMSTLLVQVIKT
ncbi:MAG: hypothetical protein ACTSQK_03235 [Candidatus Heimdallarchaeota archaeon]